MAYDSKGNRLAMTDALGRMTNYSYDANGQLVSITDPLNHTTRFSYDANGYVNSVTDALNNLTIEFMKKNFRPVPTGRNVIAQDGVERRRNAILGRRCDELLALKGRNKLCRPFRAGGDLRPFLGLRGRSTPGCFMVSRWDGNRNIIFLKAIASANRGLPYFEPVPKSLVERTFLHNNGIRLGRAKSAAGNLQWALQTLL